METQRERESGTFLKGLCCQEAPHREVHKIHLCETQNLVPGKVIRSSAVSPRELTDTECTYIKIKMERLTLSPTDHTLV